MFPLRLVHNIMLVRASSLKGYKMPHRYICSVLEEMRTCDKTKNYSYLLGLIEEAQMMADRMEASLYDKKDLNRAHRECKKVKEKKEKLEADIEKLEERMKGLSRKEKKELKKRYKDEQRNQEAADDRLAK